MTLLHVEAVEKARGARPVLRGADLDVSDQAVVALLGPSGCGKTTLLRLIAGFDAADRGRIALGGDDVDAPGRHVPAERRRIGYVPQEGTLFPHLSVAGNVGFGLSRAERRGGRIAEVLALTDLSGLERRFPHQLSGGQQQRTALARALAPNPRLLLLDEPFAGLDLALRRTVCAEVVAMLRRSRTAAILVTHDPQEALASADQVAVMQDGRIGQCADPATVYRQPASPEIARLTGTCVVIEGLAEGDVVHTVLGQLALHRPVLGPVRVMLRPDQLVRTRPGDGVALRYHGGTFAGDQTMAAVSVLGVELLLPLALPGAAPDMVHLRVEGACMAWE